MRAAAGAAFTTATSVADALVRRGVPFRVAHHLVGALVSRAETEGRRSLSELPDAAFVAELAAADDETARSLASEAGIGPAMRSAASVEAALAGADVLGGTAPSRVRAAIAAAVLRLRDLDPPTD